MTDENQNQPGGEGGKPADDAQGKPHKRRPRYSGTHPRRFEQRYKELDPAKYPQAAAHVRARGRTPAGTHVNVLPREVMAALDPRPGSIVADCTVGYGGHAADFLRRIGPGGTLLGFDIDGPQLERARRRLEPLAGPALAGGPALRLRHGNYAGLAKALAEEGLAGCDVIFADLGVSSMQVDDPSRGMSYKAPGPLDMRMDTCIPLSGADLLMRLSRRELSEALRDLADEPDHELLAEWIVNQRQAQPITRTEQLSRLVFNAKGTTEKAWRKRADYHELHPAARTFQALRILVNDELGSLRALLRTAPTCLKPGGRIGIISFHSGEDRLVKHAFRDGLAAGVYERISEDVIRPSAAEVRSNPRSSSAKFRWAQAAAIRTKEL